jgi:hypothetical protein
MLAVAPSVAPLDTPRIYGSAIGFLQMACITQPTTESPIPTNTARMVRGSRICQIMSCSEPLPSELSPVPNSSCPMMR